MTTNADEALAEYKRTVAGKPYRPANGSEGEYFRFDFCDRCSKDINDDCPIYTQTLISETDDEDYPKEWIHDADGDPTCTAFEPSYSFFKIRLIDNETNVELEIEEAGPRNIIYRPRRTMTVEELEQYRGKPIALYQVIAAQLRSEIRKLRTAKE